MVIFYTVSLTQSLAESSKIVGRDQELKTIQSLLSSPDKGFVHLCGLPGIGKTSLVQKYVQLHQHEYDYVLWLNNDSHIIDQIKNFLSKISYSGLERNEPYKTECAADLSLK